MNETELNTLAGAPGADLDDAIAANAVTIGNVANADAEATVLANGDLIADDGITAISLTDTELNTFIGANGANPLKAASVTLGAVTGNQGTVVGNLAKIVDGGISSITVTGIQYNEVSSLAKFQDDGLTLSVQNGETVDFSLDSGLAAKLAAIAVASGGSLTVSATQATTQTITGDGTITISGVTGSTDLSSLASSLTSTGKLWNDADISGNSNIGNLDNIAIDNNANVTMSIAQHAKVNAATGSNTVTISDAGTLTGLASVETYNLADGANTFTMADGGQTVVGGSGVDQITGGTGIDNITGGASDDVISAGLGADVITGGTGNDTMTGGDGADRFVFASGDTSSTVAEEKILDFKTGSDELDFGEAAGDVTIVDGSEMVLSTFLTNAGDAFDGGLDVYIAYNISGINDALVAVDHNKDGSWGAGDTLIKLSGLNEEADILSTDITTY